MGPLQTSESQTKPSYFLHEKELKERLARNPLAKIIPQVEYSASRNPAGSEE